MRYWARMTLRNWRAEQRRRVSRHRIFDVLEGDYVRDDGYRKTMTVLACPDWVNVVPLTPSREVVLVRQFRPGPEVMTLETPGGLLEAGEEPIETARRELLEETGYEASRLVSLGALFANPAIQTNRIHYFLALDARPVAHAVFDGEGEECEIVLAPLSDIEQATAPGELSHALCHTALSLARRALARIDGGLEVQQVSAAAAVGQGSRGR